MALLLWVLAILTATQISCFDLDEKIEELNNDVHALFSHTTLSHNQQAFKALDEELRKKKFQRLNFLATQSRSTKSPFQGCSNTSYPRTGYKKIPTFQVNLESSPKERWNEVVNQKKLELNRVEQFFDGHFGAKFMRSVDKYVSWLHQTLPPEYRLELEGISEQSGINVGRVTLFNVFYEFFSVCTSIILEGKNGEMYHGRNLDFGLFMGWDVKNHTWTLTELLRPLIINVEFMKNGTLTYSAVTYAGYTGVLTGLKQKAFSLSIDERFVLDGGYVGIADWLMGDRDSNWLGHLTRQVLELANSYQHAQQMLANTKLVAPVYFILAGTKSQGCIITRGRSKSDVWELGEKHKGQSGGWYLVETNYDHWHTTPFYDHRRRYAVKCMEALGYSQPLDTLYSVLSTRPVLNKETTLTALMDISSGALIVWERYCEDPCWPF